MRPDAEILHFGGVGDDDVYNPSVPFVLDGERIMAARVQARGGDRSETRFFVESGRVWVPLPGAPVLELEDPAVVTVGGELVLAGVRVIRKNGQIASWITDFYRGGRLSDLALFAHGPAHMKDIRLVELPGGRIALFSRPQGPEMVKRFGWRARIGFTVLDSIDELGPDVIESAPVLDGHFLPEEWGGCNQALALEDGTVGVVGHKAHGEMVDGVHVLHYAAMAFTIHPATRAMTPLRIICRRGDLPDGPAREPRLRDIVFPGGIVRKKDGLATLYAGVSDCAVARITIPDPFSSFPTAL